MFPLPAIAESSSLQSCGAEPGPETVFPVWITLHMILFHLAKSIARFKPGEGFMDSNLLSFVEKAYRPNTYFYKAYFFYAVSSWTITRLGRIRWLMNWKSLVETLHSLIEVISWYPLRAAKENRETMIAGVWS